MIGEPEIIFWIVLAPLAMAAVAMIGLGVAVGALLAIIEHSVKGGSTDGTDEQQEKKIAE